MRQAHERRAESLPAVSYLQCRSFPNSYCAQGSDKLVQTHQYPKVLSSYRNRTLP